MLSYKDFRESWYSPSQPMGCPATTNHVDTVVKKNKDKDTTMHRNIDKYNLVHDESGTCLIDRSGTEAEKTVLNKNRLKQYEESKEQGNLTYEEHRNYFNQLRGLS